MHIQDNESGQAAIEFILVISFALGMVFLFFAQAFNATDGYLVHYSNFMASRTYLTADQGSSSLQSNYVYAADQAREVYESYPLKSFKINSEFKVISYGEGNGLFSGSTAFFEKSVSFFPGIGGGDKAKLLSESFLGKEPVRRGCFEMICYSMIGDRRDCESSTESLDVTLYDNGC